MLTRKHFLVHLETSSSYVEFLIIFASGITSSEGETYDVNMNYPSSGERSHESTKQFSSRSPVDQPSGFANCRAKLELDQ